jgi:hypothetical protein
MKFKFYLALRPGELIMNCAAAAGRLDPGPETTWPDKQHHNA